MFAQRKETLLVEYRHLRKANTFIDRRFGGKALTCLFQAKTIRLIKLGAATALLRLGLVPLFLRPPMLK